jgi:protein TonB
MDDRGYLSHCMTDGDVESLARARWLRRKALLTSLSFEAALVGLLLLWPLMSPDGLGRPLEVPPLPPLRFTPAAAVEPALSNSAEPGVQIPVTFSSHPINSAHPQAVPGDAPSTDELGPGFGPPLIGIPIDRGGNPTIAPPWAPRESKPPRISVGVMDGSLIHRVEPEYPMIAKTMHLSGTVRMHAIIGADGTVRELQILSGNPILAKAARAAVEQWRYEPTLLGSQPVEVETYVTVNFVLE